MPRKKFFRKGCAAGYLLPPSGINKKFTQQQNKKTMKKLLFVIALGAFAACGNGENKTAAADSTKVDSVKTAAPADTTAKAADTTKAAADTTKKK